MECCRRRTFPKSWFDQKSHGLSVKACPSPKKKGGTLVQSGNHGFGVRDSSYWCVLKRRECSGMIPSKSHSCHVIIPASPSNPPIQRFAPFSRETGHMSAQVVRAMVLGAPGAPQVHQVHHRCTTKTSRCFLEPRYAT